MIEIVKFVIVVAITKSSESGYYCPIGKAIPLWQPVGLNSATKINRLDFFMACSDRNSVILQGTGVTGSLAKEDRVVSARVPVGGYLIFLIQVLLLPVVVAGGVTWHVEVNGDDGNSGRDPGQAFRTIQHGVSVLEAGDTLLIGPGEYVEAVMAEGLGGADADTVIRARIPGTVLLRGDREVMGFEPVAGYRRVFAVAVEGPVYGVIERDTETVFKAMPGVGELEFAPGTFFHDAEAGLLYVSPTDGRPPAGHHYTITIHPSRGIELINARRVTIADLSVTGFATPFDVRRAGAGYGVAWGIFLANPIDCTIRNCVSFLNGGGIAFQRLADGRGNRIDSCLAFANAGGDGDAGGGIQGFASDHDLIINSYAYRCGTIGVGFYGAGIQGPSELRNNKAWGNGLADMRIKGGGGGGTGVPPARAYGMTEGCVTLGNLDAVNLRSSIVGAGNIYLAETPEDSIALADLSPEELDASFADPVNLDFRLQYDSPLRGTGPDGADPGPAPYQANVFYLSPQGDDAASGLSLASSWRTLDHAFGQLRAGDTLYMVGGGYSLSGRHRVGTSGGEAVSIISRGSDVATIAGDFELMDSHAVQFERVQFNGAVNMRDSSGIHFGSCVFSGEAAGLAASAVKGLAIRNGLFVGMAAPAVQLQACEGVWLSDTVFAGEDGVAVAVDAATQFRYSDHNSYPDKDVAWRIDGAVAAAPGRYSRSVVADVVAVNGHPVILNRAAFSQSSPGGSRAGPYRSTERRPLDVAEPVLHSVTNESANIEWWVSAPSWCVVEWRGPGGEVRRERVFTAGYATYSVTGLDADTAYEFRLVAAEPDNISAAQGFVAAESGAVLKVTTAAAAAPPRVYHVAVVGDDRNDGLSPEQAFRSIARAAAAANAGDTVMVGGGEYMEQVRIRATGVAGRPVTIRSAPGEKVLMRGMERQLETAIDIKNKSYVNIDGLYFMDFGNRSWAGVINCVDSDNITITRCFDNGRGRGYSPGFVNAERVDTLTIRNCVLTNGMVGITLWGCPNVLIEHCVFLRNMIQALMVANNIEQPIMVRNNIFTDSVRQKARTMYIQLARTDGFSETGNCFYMRLPDEERRPFFLYSDDQYVAEMEAHSIPVIFAADHQPRQTERLTLAQFQQRYSPDSTSYYGQPLFRMMLDWEDLDPDHYYDGRLINAVNDFDDLFATDPHTQEIGAGLQPEAFVDMLGENRAD